MAYRTSIVGAPYPGPTERNAVSAVATAIAAPTSAPTSGQIWPVAVPPAGGGGGGGFDEEAGDARYLKLAGGAMTGLLTLAGGSSVLGDFSASGVMTAGADPSAPLDLSTRRFTETYVGSAVGAIPIPGSFKGAWSSGTTYLAGSTVSHNGFLWGTTAAIAAGLAEPALTSPPVSGIPPGTDLVADAPEVEVATDGENLTQALWSTSTFGSEGDGGKSGWVKYKPISSGSVVFDTIGSGFDTYLGLYKLPTGNTQNFAGLTNLAGDDDSGGGGASRFTYSVVAGDTYLIRLAGYSSNSGNIKLNLTGARATAPHVSPWTRITALGAPAVLNLGTAAPTGAVGNTSEYFLDQDDHILYGPKPAAKADVSVHTASSTNNSSSTYGGQEVGLRITCAAAGFITHFRYFRYGISQSSRTMRLWSDTGTLLSSVATTGETGLGWFTVPLTTPVAITAGQQVVVSFNAISEGPTLQTLPVINGSLTATQGVYIGTPGSFPASTWALDVMADIVFSEPTVWPVAVLGVPQGGTAAQVLTKSTATDFAVAWVTPPPGVQSRATVAKTTASIAAGASESGTIALSSGYRLYKITTSGPARVRLYTTGAKRDNDLNRAIGTDPSGDHGVVLDFVTTSTLLTADLSPTVDGFDGKTPPDGGIPYIITNTGVAAAAITVSLAWIRTE